MPFITVLQNTESASAGGKFKGLILAWIFAAGFIFAIVFVLFFFSSISETDHTKLINLWYPKEKIRESRWPQLTPACKSPSLINHRFTACLIDVVIALFIVKFSHCIKLIVNSCNNGHHRYQDLGRVFWEPFWNENNQKGFLASFFYNLFSFWNR